MPRMAPPWEEWKASTLRVRTRSCSTETAGLLAATATAHVQSQVRVRRASELNSSGRWEKRARLQLSGSRARHCSLPRKYSRVRATREETWRTSAPRASAQVTASAVRADTAGVCSRPAVWASLAVMSSRVVMMVLPMAVRAAQEADGRSWRVGIRAPLSRRRGRRGIHPGSPEGRRGREPAGTPGPRREDRRALGDLTIRRKTGRGGADQPSFVILL